MQPGRAYPKTSGQATTRHLGLPGRPGAWPWEDGCCLDIIETATYPSLGMLPPQTRLVVHEGALSERVGARRLWHEASARLWPWWLLDDAAPEVLGKWVRARCHRLQRCRGLLRLEGRGGRVGERCRRVVWRGTGEGVRGLALQWRG